MDLGACFSCPQEDEKIDLAVFKEIETSALTLQAYTNLLKQFSGKVIKVPVPVKDQDGKPIMDADGSIETVLTTPPELQQLLAQVKTMTDDIDHIKDDINDWKEVHTKLKGPLKGIPIIKPLVEKFATAVRTWICGMSRGSI